MADTAIYPEDIHLNSRLHPERLAWMMLIGAFVVFCLICFSTSLGLYYFFFQSSVNLNTVLQVGRGTVGVREGTATEEAESDQRELFRDSTVRTDRTDALSQATITFRDTDTDNMVAVVTLKGGTSLRFRSALGPRFEWSYPVYEMDIIDFQGEIDIIVPDNLGRDIDIRIRTPQGVEARLGDSGRYLIDASDTRVRLTNRQGEAVLIAADGVSGRSVPVGQRAVISTGIGETAISFIPAFTELTSNGALSPLEVDEDVYGLPGWSCFTNPPNNMPRGDYRFAYSPDGHQSLRLVRGDNATNNGEVRCEQRLGITDFGQAVSQYNYLSLRVRLYIDFQSLSACGTEATECPLMLRINYFDTDGVERYWVHGVYARADPGVNYLLRCAGICRSDHVQIYDKGWYIYESGNLVEILSGIGIRPQAITEVIFYASGHQYDVYVDEVALLAGNIPPAQNGTVNPANGENNP